MNAGKFQRGVCICLDIRGIIFLCSDWDRSDMEGLDYNGLYEYLYRMKYGERYEFSGNSSGIPAEEFENLIMEFLPITADQIKNGQYLIRNIKLMTGND